MFLSKYPKYMSGFELFPDTVIYKNFYYMLESYKLDKPMRSQFPYLWIKTSNSGYFLYDYFENKIEVDLPGTSFTLGERHRYFQNKNIIVKIVEFNPFFIGQISISTKCLYSVDENMYLIRD